MLWKGQISFLPGSGSGSHLMTRRHSLQTMSWTLFLLPPPSSSLFRLLLLLLFFPLLLLLLLSGGRSQLATVPSTVPGPMAVMCQCPTARPSTL